MDMSKNVYESENIDETEDDENIDNEKNMSEIHSIFINRNTYTRENTTIDEVPNRTSTSYQAEVDLDDLEHVDINVLFKIRNNIEDQITVRTNDINFKTLIENTIPEMSLKPEVNNIIAAYHQLFTTEKLENENKILERYLNKLNDVIHGLCEHEYHEDYIDITPDDCLKIIYCSKCKITDLKDREIKQCEKKCC